MEDTCQTLPNIVMYNSQIFCDFNMQAQVPRDTLEVDPMLFYRMKGGYAWKLISVTTADPR